MSKRKYVSDRGIGTFTFVLLVVVILVAIASVSFPYKGEVLETREYNRVKAGVVVCSHIKDIDDYIVTKTYQEYGPREKIFQNDHCILFFNATKYNVLKRRNILQPYLVLTEKR